MRPTDRVIELDIDALGGAGRGSRATEVVARLEPLWRDAIDSGGTVGLVLNLGWLMDPIVLFSGNPGQTLPIQSSRLDAYSRMTYLELGQLVSDLRLAAERRGISDLRVGMLVLGIGEFVNEIVRAPHTGTEQTMEGALYLERGEWYARHPELFPIAPAVTLHGPGVDWRVRMAEDRHSYASKSDGITEGTAFNEFFADQWAEVADTVGFDLLVMRDETTTPVHAGRVAFDGSSTPATGAEVDEWTDALIAVTVALKHRSPNTVLVLYSSGLSPTVELRFGRLDIPRVVAAGGVDVWIDQTWGGAWQDWWDAGWQGWSFQLSNLLARAAMIAAGNRLRQVPCRHYPLFQLLDGWEPYDTLHDYPEKLTWGIWAFSHASVRDESGEVRTPRGAYLAVANDRTGRLISAHDVTWISHAMTGASISASAVQRVLGPTLVVPERGASLASSATAESVEDATGFLGKWGVPVLSSVSADIVGERESEGLVLAAGTAEVTREVAAPTLVVGAPEDLEPTAAALLGVRVRTTIAPSGYRRGTAKSPGLSSEAWPYMGRRHATALAPGGTTIYGGEDGPTAVRAGSRIWWVPPHVANGADRRLTHYQVGTVDPHVAVAWELARMRSARGLLAMDPLPRHHTISLHGWISAGTLHVLVGNVESGWIGDSRYPREAVVHLPADLVEPLRRPHLVLQDGSAIPVSDSAVTVPVRAEGYVLGRLHDLSEGKERLTWS